MRVRSALLVVVVASLAAAGPIVASGDDARAAAERLGRALTSGGTTALEPILPAEGKIQLALRVLARASGAYGPGQTEAVLSDALARRPVAAFEIDRVESDGGPYALVRAHARVACRGRAPQDVALYLALHREGDRWVLRELRETGP